VNIISCLPSPSNRFPAMPAKTTAKEWDAIRAAFASSLMAKTSLSSLAQNLDGPDWPIKSKDETPAKYLGLGHEEVLGLLELQGQSPERLDLLASILRDTLAFDTPFGDMVEQTQAAADHDNPVLKNLAKLAIPADFPVELTALSADTKDFCRREKLSTLSEFALAAQRMAQSVIVGGDFRALLNALSHVDEPAIARFLPFRPGAKGLHLIEAVALAVRALPADQRVVTKGSPPAALAAHITRLATYFAADKTELEKQLAEPGNSLTRASSVLRDPAIEPVVVALLAPHINARAAASAKSGGWFSRLFKK
jgi:hypothetical protein